MLTKITSAILIALYFVGLFYPETIKAVSVTTSSEWWSLFAYAFFHQNIFHLLINVLVFYSFGQVVESAIGKREFPQVLILSAFITSLPYWIFPLSELPLIGFSGVVYFVFAAFTGFFPYISVSVLFVKTSFPVRLVFFTIFGVEAGLFAANLILDLTPIAHISHLIGLSLGLLYAYRKRGSMTYIHTSNFDKK
jgi:membrane associated rhomboid family serine protease